jgi:hypothetical protein
MILKLITDLGSLTTAQINDTLMKSREIIEHNRYHFFSDQFEKILLDELKSNMKTCLERQTEKQQRFPGGSCLYQFDRLIERGVELPQVQSNRIKNILRYLKTSDADRLSAILAQHPWLRDRGFV